MGVDRVPSLRGMVVKIRVWPQLGILPSLLLHLVRTVA